MGSLIAAALAGMDRASATGELAAGGGWPIDSGSMFSVEVRDRVRETLIERARSDSRLVSAAAVGASAGGGDRWSDIDLTFGVADGVTVEEVLAEWTDALETGFGAAVLFDLPLQSTIYRVFLLPGALQVDLSFTPAGDFGARGPRFHLLFGDAVERPPVPSPTPGHMFGLGVHHAVRASICIERGRPWQAEYWIHEARDQALSLACLRRGLEPDYGRGFDSLPPEVREPFTHALVANLGVVELRLALASVTAGLLHEADGILDVATTVRPILEELCHPAST